MSLYLANSGPPNGSSSLPGGSASGGSTEVTQRPNFPGGLSPATHAAQLGTKSLLMSSGGHPVWLWGLPCQQQPPAGPQPRSRYRPPAPEMLTPSEGLCFVGTPNPYSRRPAAWPCWARSKMYENTSTISLKLLRNKVVLLLFHNPSKKKSSHWCRGRGQPWAERRLSRNACCGPAASGTPRRPPRRTR